MREERQSNDIGRRYEIRDTTTSIISIRSRYWGFDRLQNHRPTPGRPSGQSRRSSSCRPDSRPHTRWVSCRRPGAHGETEIRYDLLYRSTGSKRPSCDRAGNELQQSVGWSTPGEGGNRLGTAPCSDPLSRSRPDRPGFRTGVRPRRSCPRGPRDDGRSPPIAYHSLTVEDRCLLSRRP